MALTSDSDPALSIPPPSVAELPLTLVLTSDSDPALSIPPPSVAELPLTVVLTIDSDPALSIPPPSAALAAGDSQTSDLNHGAEPYREDTEPGRLRSCAARHRQCRGPWPGDHHVGGKGRQRTREIDRPPDRVGELDPIRVCSTPPIVRGEVGLFDRGPKRAATRVVQARDQDRGGQDSTL